MIVHEPASTEAHEAEDIPAAEPTAAEDIVHDDNVEDDEVLPQIEYNVVSSLVRTNSEKNQHCSSSDANCSGCIMG